MFLKHLSLTNFRNYARLELDFPTRVIVLQGQNAQGKTNLLEAIYYLAITRSPRADNDRQLINWLAGRDELPFARLVAEIESGRGPLRIETTLMQEPDPHSESSSSVLRRSFKLNGVKRRALDLLGQVQVILFLPEDIDLVSGPPARRRRYLDVTICQIDAFYCRHLQQYNQVLAQRNSLLRTLRDRGGDPDQLAFWDQKLVEWGSYLTARREQIVSRLNEHVAGTHAAITEGSEHLRLTYRPGVLTEENGGSDGTPVGSDPQQLTVSREEVQRIEHLFAAQLHQARPDEIARGATQLGPHRDDISFLVDGVDMRTYGSRGQQRTVALSLKLAEVQLMHEETGETPILLLDDVLSELDAARRACVLAMLGDAEQVIITTTEIPSYAQGSFEGTTIWRVEQGRISPDPPPAS